MAGQTTNPAAQVTDQSGWGQAADPVPQAQGPPAPPRALLHLTVLGGWALRTAGEPVALPMGLQRLVALLALAGPKPRAAVAGTLWPEGTDQRAFGSLRTTLWRLQSSGLRLLAADPGALALAPNVQVDVHEFLASARLIARGDDPGTRAPALVMRGGELLPGWGDEWVALERERIHQLRLHALEALSDRLLKAGRHADALEAALAAVAVEPLRESARRAAVRVHLAESNQHEAIRQYLAFRDLLRSELGVEPSPALTGLVGSQAAAGARLSRPAG
jgi:DNA-binding SARP family transcriptional activator